MLTNWHSHDVFFFFWAIHQMGWLHVGVAWEEEPCKKGQKKLVQSRIELETFCV